MDRIIGLDLGSKTCGVSICDALHITCRALTTVRFESDDYDACLEEVLKLLQENKVRPRQGGARNHRQGVQGVGQDNVRYDRLHMSTATQFLCF